MPTSTIEWTDDTWNPVIGCTRVSPGCERCYAERMSGRLASMAVAANAKGEKMGRRGPYRDVVKWRMGPGDESVATQKWNNKVKLLKSELDVPLHRRKPCRFFVCSMSDLFHPAVPDAFRDQVFAVMGLCPQHLFMVLTKRPERLAPYTNAPGREDAVLTAAVERAVAYYRPRPKLGNPSAFEPWPLPNVWVGTSVETQAYAPRVADLLRAKAALYFVSAEPLLGWVSLDAITFTERTWVYNFNALKPSMPGGPIPGRPIPPNRKVSWVIVGGESGPGARPMEPAWANALKYQCITNGVPFFFKQWGGRTSKTKRSLYGREWNETPCWPAAGG